MILFMSISIPLIFDFSRGGGKELSYSLYCVIVGLLLLSSLTRWPYKMIFNEPKFNLR